MMDSLISEKLQFSTRSVKQVLTLLEEGATVPFIARYRKERTGSLDEVAIGQIESELKRIQKLEKRKATIITAIEDQEKLTSELERRIQDCWDATELEDIYLPFKRGRKTKADRAIAQGLEPLAKIISAQKTNRLDQDARRFFNKEISTVEDALQGARYIISSWVNENTKTRSMVRSMFERYAMLECSVVKKKKEDAEKYWDYHNYEGRLSRTPSHRLLAMLRGEEEGLLRVKVTIDESRALERIKRYYIKSNGPCAIQIELAVKDALKRLLLPSVENEYRKIAKENADQEAIEVFAKNLRQLLAAPPLGGFPVLALDPGFRTGCKLVVLDSRGSLLYKNTIYPHPPVSKGKEAMEIVSKQLSKYNIKHIAIGNGTAGRETCQFLKNEGVPADLYMVNESGASIYSASEIAREEFPNEDITVRGAVSIGRRLMDPLAELVKIDPKSIGVGQYQHDVNQGLLKESLDRVVASVVNMVGINLNTASKHLLQYVSGIGPSLSENIITYRDKIGGFTERRQLLDVPRMGTKAYEQAAGFLRIKGGDKVLDGTGVHPERYQLVTRMLSDHQIDGSRLSNFSEEIKNIELSKYVSDDVGIPTLKDIINELLKPGLDPRGEASTIQFSTSLRSIEDLEAGMIVTGVINNLTKFGAFVDFGIKESGLIHISQITNRFISDPAEVLHLGQEVKAKILEVDVSRKRISLTLRY